MQDASSEPRPVVLTELAPVILTELAESGPWPPPLSFTILRQAEPTPPSWEDLLGER
jgi:hypothetical protein